MAMYDINGEEFQVGDTLKVIKREAPLKCGDIVVCLSDEGVFCSVVGDLDTDCVYYPSYFLQKI